MKQAAISLDEVTQPERLRDLVNEIRMRQFDLLEQMSGMEAALRSGNGTVAGWSEEDRSLLQALALGSTDNPVSSQRAIVPSVDSLPSVNTAISGEMVRLTTDGIVYVFDGPTRSWQDIGAAVPSNMMTTTTNQTPGATVVKTWTAAQVFNGGLSAAAVVNITAGGLNIDAGGATISGDTNIEDELLLSGVAVIDNTASPYTVADNISIVIVNTSGGAVTVNMPASVKLYRCIAIKDASGNAGANNITISGNGNNIDGAASLTLNINYQSRLIQGSGSDWSVLLGWL